MIEDVWVSHRDCVHKIIMAEGSLGNLLPPSCGHGELPAPPPYLTPRTDPKRPIRPSGPFRTAQISFRPDLPVQTLKLAP